MGLFFYKWSKTAAINASADSNINFAEGQAPSSVNDSCRALMASAAGFRDDISGAIVTGGTSTSYTVASNQIFDSLSNLNGQMIAFTPHATNGATVTLNVDGLGAKPLRSAPSVELPAGVLVQGTPYAALYNSSDGAFYLHGFFNNPYSIPVGSCIDFFGTTAPNSSFVLAYGQAISRTTYSTLFSIFSTTYGAGDGTTTFNVPDLRGRFTAGADGMGGTLAGRLNATGGMSGTGLGAVGGAQTHTLTLGELPTGITSSGTASVSVSSAVNVVLPNGAPLVPVSSGAGNYGLNSTPTPTIGSLSSSGSGSVSATSNNTSGAAHSIVPPTIVANKLLRII